VLAMLLEAGEQTERAIAQLRRAIELREDYAAAQLALADMLAKSGRRRDAAQHYRTFLDGVTDDLASQVPRVKRWLRANQVN
jgi:hypothetical protein